MKGFPVIISFYTKDTAYEKEVQTLINSCARFGLTTSIEAVPTQGSWELNCAYKPFFIRQKLMELQKPLLWVDADGEFVAEPSWQKAFEVDLSVRLHPELSWDHPSKVITSTLFLQPTSIADQLLKSWCHRCKEILCDPARNEEFWDQMALRDVLATAPAESFAPIPLTYAKIFDHPGDAVAAPHPIILHHQASRRLKY